MATENKILDGTDLILSVGEGLSLKALGYSTGCKISTTTETVEVLTKEASSGRWKTKRVKSFSESITADGLVLLDGGDDKPTYDQLKDMQTSGEPIDVRYVVRDGSTREGKAESGYHGKYVITSLDLDGQAGDDAKYSVKLDNSGPVTKAHNGLPGSSGSHIDDIL